MSSIQIIQTENNEDNLSSISNEYYKVNNANRSTARRLKPLKYEVNPLES
jgi:hypothetical protein